MQMAGRVHKFGDHVDTDVIVPGRYLSLRDPKALAPYCLEGLDPEFAGRVQHGDVLVAGRNFGCGSSREHAPVALKAVGLGCVVAASFARIFYRNAINIGLPVLVCSSFAAAAAEGDAVRVDLERAIIEREGRVFHGEPLGDMVRRIVEAGGLVPHVRARLQTAEQ